jgi:hypothetical protein
VTVKELTVTSLIKESENNKIIGVNTVNKTNQEFKVKTRTQCIRDRMLITNVVLCSVDHCL